MTITLAALVSFASFASFDGIAQNKKHSQSEKQFDNQLDNKPDNQSDVGYRLEQNDVVFVFQPHLYSYCSSSSGKLTPMRSLEIHSVAVACEANYWSMSEWRMNASNKYWYELRVPRSVFKEKAQWTFKFVINAQFWVEPVPTMKNTVLASVTQPNKPSDGQRLDFIATIPQPHFQQHTFRLSGYENAREVFVAGSFNNWDVRATPMTNNQKDKSEKNSNEKNRSEWTATLWLKPMSYAYKFIVDGEWMTDPANADKVDDGVGHTNSFMVIPSLQGSTEFILPGYPRAKKVAVAGTFNGWNPEQYYFARLPRKQTDTVWMCRLSLRPGRYDYRFIVDNQWISDPLNSVSVPNEFGETNSVLILPNTAGNAEFTLKGYERAKTVALAGTFNGWSERRHLFVRQGGRWVCRLTLKPGKYLYKFVVDNEWILDPANSSVVENEFGTGNNVVVVK